MQLADSVAAQVTQDDAKGIVSEFIKAYYQGRYSERSKFYDVNGRYVQHNGEIFIGSKKLDEAFTDFEGISKVSIKTDTCVVTARYEILLQSTGIYVVNGIEYPFAEALILTPVGKKRYAVSDGAFKWTNKCPPTFLFKAEAVEKKVAKEVKEVPVENVKQNGNATNNTQAITVVKTSPKQPPRNVSHRANGTQPNTEVRPTEKAQNGVNGTTVGNPDDSKKNKNKKRNDKDEPKKVKKVEGNGQTLEDKRKNLGVLHVSGFRFYRKPNHSALVYDLNKHFSQYAPVAQVYVPRRVFTNEGPIYAFVEYADQKVLDKVFPDDCEVRKGQKRLFQNVDFINCGYRGSITISEARDPGNSREPRQSDDEVANRENNWNGEKTGKKVGGNAQTHSKTSYSNDLSQKTPALKTY